MRAIAGGPPRVVFDVGANIGQTAERVRRAFPAARIVSFEPVPSTFARLADHVRDLPGIEAVNAAVGAQVGEIEMTAATESTANTVETSARPSYPTIVVPMTTVDAYMASAGIDAVDVLKIDTEGHELPVLHGARHALESGVVRFVLAECDFAKHDEEPHALFFDLFDQLTPLGYHVMCFYCQGVFSTGWHWGDVLFMRRTEIPKTIEQVRTGFPFVRHDRRVLNARTDAR